MSHYTRVRTALTDQDTLVRALNGLGFTTVESHAAPQPLVGYQGDTRPQKAEVIVRRAFVGRLSNDIGFARAADGTFQAIVGDYDRAEHGDAWLAEVAQRYGYESARAFAEENGYEILTDERDEEGAIRLTLRREAY